MEYKNFSDKMLKTKKIEFIKLLHRCDEDFFIHKEKHLKAKDKQKRYLWLPGLGVIMFKRRRYYDSKKQRYVYLLDQYLEIPKNQLVLKQHQKYPLTFYPLLSSYSKVASMIFDGNLSKSTIGRYIKNTELDTSYKNYKCIHDGILYINVDGLWVNLWKQKEKVETKNFSFYIGKKQVGKNRYKLLGRNILSLVNKNIKTIYEEIRYVINHYSDVRELRVIGDGARWIKNIAKALNANYYLDKFHFHKTIIEVVTKNNLYTVLKYVQDFKKSKKEIRKLILEKAANEKTGEINQKTLKKVGYLINNIDYYRMSVIDHMESSIEAIQSHYIAKNLKRSRKGFKPITLIKILKIISSQANGFFAHQAWEDNNDVDISWFGRTGKNIPIFQYGDSGTETYKRIKQIIDYSH